MKYEHVYRLFLMLVFCTSCGGQNKPDTVTSPGSKGLNIYSKYEYTDSAGKRLIIQNSFSRGIIYTEPNGKKANKVLFWTRITNETESPLELNIDFPVEYEVPSLPGRYFKILLPSDTMTLDKEPLPDYGITDLKSFLDNNIHKPATLKRTIEPKGSGGFYVAILFDIGVVGPFRTGLSIKGQNLFYKVMRYAGKQGRSLIDEKEINCGSINLKKLILQK
ncbi:hypothetical protein Q4E93_02395 [Flavitalea sp. BT771]|uniref:hypothetical protein n=1 Tax=Flavitalea sp. BT771 TaxID=3063329 RepID=UPI0026E39608|nr:hypothetical protein [Flavitalea sp. BT771]MDO6429421.1 hypothetical protein [Flavitalea sp. BT771]MDV6218451.1 hypothetical protein [Flavitalea sp. BT771]